MNKRESIKTLISMMGGYDTKQGTWESGWDEAISDAIEIAKKLDEQEKPTIPQFVADWIEENEDLTLMYIGFEFFSNKIKDEDVDDWIRNNQEQFCRAFLAWPNVEVEKEKAYQVIFPDGSNLVSKAVGNFDNKNTFIGKPGDMGIHSFTEKTIKSLDPRYFVFAEEVTE